ncbi:hypothetical protein LTR62_008239 [Meristemomyces frigidus]|uniref:Uncharacterized protein n=1 Tax=Meristemomyces frigidus TaxID=1508187 RepID=A0AAN7YLZ1_9PEZI|nr:hypothetical protein LTR62_008239 [Meristemomyces frigidus]
MVQVTVTEAARIAIQEYCIRQRAWSEIKPEAAKSRLDGLSDIAVGGPINHAELVEISKALVNSTARDPAATGDDSRQWRLDKLLRGASIHRRPAPPSTRLAQTAEYKALMQRLRIQEEQRQYDRMVNLPTVPETFGQRFPNASGRAGFNPAISHGYTGSDEEDDVTFQDVNRQMILIINVLISIICCSVFIWIAARRWSVPSRLGLSMSGSGIVAFAEVAIYLGYIRRLSDAKLKEKKVLEQKEVVETWVIDKTSNPTIVPVSTVKGVDSSLRLRKARHE